MRVVAPGGPMNELDVRRPYLSGGIIVNGEAAAVRQLLESIKAEAAKNRVRVIFATVSSKRLWVKEGDPTPPS